jgi:hypothetical protein
MTVMTGAATVRLLPPDSLLLRSGGAIREAVVALYLGYWRSRALPVPVSVTVGVEPKVPALSPWLLKVELRIQGSLIDPNSPSKDQSRYLDWEVGAAALKFFRETADLMPSEPYMYASTEGDLVAEFNGDGGSLTIVIARDHIILFASIDQQPFVWRFGKGGENSINLRRRLSDIRHMLGEGADGSVASAG